MIDPDHRRDVVDNRARAVNMPHPREHHRRQKHVRQLHQQAEGDRQHIRYHDLDEAQGLER